MHTLPFFVGLSLALSVSSCLVANAQEEGGTRREAKALFASSCSSCHVYPDASLATDRAWLGQILETS